MRQGEFLDDLRVIRINVQRDRGRTMIRGVAAKDADALIVSPSVDFHVSAEPEVAADAVAWVADELRRLLRG